MIHNLQNKQIIKTGSKSFFLASLFFTNKTKYDSWSLYQWCRYCDDKIDNSPPEHLQKNFEFILNETKLALENPDTPLLFQNVGRLASKYDIPHAYFYDVLAGFKSDAFKEYPQTEKDLLNYSYQVAGAVGLIMSYIMGLNNPKALNQAVAMGLAMQLTNIARDVREDTLNQRCYLPQEWLQQKNLNSNSFLKPEYRSDLYQLVEQLLQKSDSLYNQGRSGLEHLPLRAAWAVSIASHIYAAIGKKIRKQGPWSLDQRVVISPLEKVYWLIVASLKMIPITLKRIRNPWKRISLRHVEYVYE